jgi:hypothetical protein
MTAKNTCEMCAAFSAISSECRRHAPKPFAISQPPKVVIIGGWPGTIKSNWCEDFLPGIPFVEGLSS